MTTRQTFNYPTHYKGPSRAFARRGREQMIFLAAAGLALSLIVIFAVVFSFSDSSGSKEKAAPAAVPPALATITLYSPERSVKAGAKLSEVSWKEMYWPRNDVPEGAVRDLAELKSMYAKTDLDAGKPVQRIHLTKEPANISLPLRSGFRAVSIAVDAVASIEQHARPGSYVDVVLTYYEQGNLTSKVIVENARVLSLGGDTRSASESVQPVSSTTRTTQVRTITLEVEPSNALKITTSVKLGSLNLIMRAMDDNKPLATREVDAGDINGDMSKTKWKSPKDCAGGGGRVKISGREFLVGCGGQLSEVVNGLEP